MDYNRNMYLALESYYYYKRESKVEAIHLYICGKMMKMPALPRALLTFINPEDSTI
jgi:hypothetical protein